MTFGPTSSMTLEQILAAYDAFISGVGISEETDRVATAVTRASAYAASAYELSMGCGQDVHALARSFLLALIDPLHVDLDYLRADPMAGAIERAKREQANG